MRRRRTQQRRRGVDELDYQISQLQSLSSPGNTHAVDQDTLSKQISQKLIALLQGRR